jgi:S1-C subfamily serine protease
LVFPIDTAKVVAEQIINKGYFTHPFLGVGYEPITPDIASTYNLPVKWGAYITRVAANSPASTAGLKQGDIIIGVGDVTLNDTHSYLNTLYGYKPGDKVTLTVIRDGKTLELEVTLGEAPHK